MIGAFLLKATVALILSSSLTATYLTVYNPEWTPKKHYKLREPVPIEQVQRSATGSSSGDHLSSSQQGALNLMLLSDPKVSQYVRDYFKIALECEQGKLTKCKTTIGVKSIFGVNISESGTIADSFIPRTFVKCKIKGVNNGATYDYGATYGDTKVSLMGLNPDIIQARNSAVVENIQDAADTAGRDRGPFQQQYDFFQRESGRENAMTKPAIGYNWQGGSSSRKSSVYYFPDEVAGLVYNMEDYMNRYSQYYKGIKINDILQIVLFQTLHGGGEGVIIRQCFGYMDNSKVSAMSVAERQKGFDALAREFSLPDYAQLVEEIEKKGVILYSGAPHNVFTNVYLVRNGWKFGLQTKQMGFDQISSKDFKVIYEVINKKKCPYGSYSEFQQANTNPSDYNPICEQFGCGKAHPINSTGQYQYTKLYKKISDKQVIFFPYITLRNIFNMVGNSNLYYAKMLKQMGLKTDPLKPETYLTNLQQKGEFVPEPIKDSGAGSTGKVCNILKSKNPKCELARFDKTSLCYYFTEKSKIKNGFSSDAMLHFHYLDPENWSSIGSVGEKDGMPLFPQWSYYSGVKAQDGSTGVNLQQSGCSIFTLTSALYGIGYGDVKNGSVPKLIKEIDDNGDKDGLLTAWEVNKYLIEELANKQKKCPYWYISGAGMTGQFPKIVKALGLPVEAVDWDGNKEAQLKKTIDLMNKGYPVLASFNSPPVKMYSLEDKENKKVKFKQSSALTGSGHYILLYAYDTYTDEKGNKVKGVNIIDSSQRSQNNASNYILDLDSLYDAKTPNVPCTVIKKPLISISGASPSSSENSGGSSTVSDSYYVDDSFKLSGDTSTIDDFMILVQQDSFNRGGTYGYVSLLGYNKNKVYLKCKDLKTTPDKIVFKVDNSNCQYELTGESNKIFVDKKATASYDGKFSDLLQDKTATFFTIRKYDLKNNEYIDLFERM